MMANDTLSDDQAAGEQPADEIKEVLQNQSSPEAAESSPDQLGEETTPAPEDLNQFVADLHSADKDVRSLAIIKLQEVETSSIQVLRALEYIAANDKIPDLRERAISALQSPTHQNERFRSQYLTIHTRRWLHQEINQWEADQAHWLAQG